MENTGGKLCEEGLDDMIKHDSAFVPKQSVGPRQNYLYHKVFFYQPCHISILWDWDWHTIVNLAPQGGIFPWKSLHLAWNFDGNSCTLSHFKISWIIMHIVTFPVWDRIYIFHKKSTTTNNLLPNSSITNVIRDNFMPQEKTFCKRK